MSTYINSWNKRLSNSKYEVFVDLPRYFMHGFSWKRGKNKANVKIKLGCWRLSPGKKQREKLRQLDPTRFVVLWVRADIYIERTRPVLCPLGCGFVDSQSWLEPGDCEVPEHWLVRYFVTLSKIILHWYGHCLGLIVDVGDFLDDKSEGVVPWQRFIHEVEICGDKYWELMAPFIVPTCKRVFLLVVMCWETPDEGVVVLADVCIHLLQRVVSSLVTRKKNLVRNNFGVNILHSDINRVDVLEVFHKPVVWMNWRKETEMKCSDQTGGSWDGELVSCYLEHRIVFSYKII